MDTQSALLILRLISEGIGVASEIAALARRVRDGEVITQEEINKAREEVKVSVNKWDDAAKETDIAVEETESGE